MLKTPTPPFLKNEGGIKDTWELKDHLLGLLLILEGFFLAGVKGRI